MSQQQNLCLVQSASQSTTSITTTQSDRRDTQHVKCYAAGLRFINGISNRFSSIIDMHDVYDTNYPSELCNIITEEQFRKDIEKINDSILEFWPCGICFCFGFACAPLSLGTSLLCPNYCISKAETNANRCLDDINHSRSYYGTGIEWSLHKSCCSSWVEIKFPKSAVHTTTP